MLPRVHMVMGAALTACLSLASLGCSSPVARRVEPRFRLHGSEAPAAIVFSDPGSPELATIGPELARLDGTLSPRIASAQHAIDAWPEPARPSLRHTRRILVNQRPDTFIYFDRVPDRSGRGSHPWW